MTFIICSRAQLLKTKKVYYTGGPSGTDDCWSFNPAAGMQFQTLEGATAMKIRLNRLEDKRDPDKAADLRWWVTEVTHKPNPFKGNDFSWWMWETAFTYIDPSAY